MKNLIQDLEQQYMHKEMCFLNHVVVVNSELDMMVPAALLIEAKICALMAHIRYDLCTKGHSNHPT